jgi:pilus assembly protein CpaE
LISALNNLKSHPHAAAENTQRHDWIWKIGLVLETPELIGEIASALDDAGAARVFEFPASASPFEVANAVDREKPDLLFVEMARTQKTAAEWISEVRRGDDTPLVAAVHTSAEPAEMIAALRAGASEFLSLPMRPAIYEAMNRIGSLLEARRNATIERGTIAGVLSAKGGCGATSFACHLSAALLHQAGHPNPKQPGASPAAAARMRILVADLDYQSPGGSGVFRSNPHSHAGAAFDSVRLLSSSAWRDFATPVVPGIDLLASPADVPAKPNAAGVFEPVAPPPEQWRVESLFRFLSRQYNWVFADLGRHLNPANWVLLQNIEELFIVTAPDVLALYQTRSVLQTLSNRGFDKNRIRIILNRNLSTPKDFWVESIEQMFEKSVFGVVPNDDGTFEKLPRDRFEFPSETPFGRAMTKEAARLSAGNAGPKGKAA